MQISTRGRYAVMAMVDLALHQPDACQPDACLCGPVCLAEIAERQQLSLSYLEQLFGRLRRAGLVSSARGPGGGYRLAKPAERIAIADIVGAVGEPIRTTRCEATGGCMVDDEGHNQHCQTHELWKELQVQISYFLEGVTLADVIAHRVAGRATRLTAPAGWLAAD